MIDLQYHAGLWLEVQLKAGLLAVLAAAAAMALRRQDAALRHLVQAVFVVLLLLLPVLVPALPGWRLGPPAGAAAVAESVPVLPPAAKVEEEAVSRGPFDQTGPAAASWLSSPAATSWLPSPAVWLAFWLLGAAGLLARLVRAHWHTARLVGRCRPAPRGLLPPCPRTACLPVLCSPEIELPALAGLRKPVILLPEVARTWSAERLGLVLQHELAHHRRRDLFWYLAADVACALYWFNPLVWRLRRRLRADSE